MIANDYRPVGASFLFIKIILKNFKVFIFLKKSAELKYFIKSN